MRYNQVAAVLIVVGLIFSFAVVGVNYYFNNHSEVKIGDVSVNKLLNIDSKDSHKESQILTFDELNFTSDNDTDSSENSTDSSVDVINLNYTQVMGKVNIHFQNTSDVCNVTSDNSTGGHATLSHSTSNGTANIIINSDSELTDIVLSNEYTYNINGQIVSGQANMDVEKNCSVSVYNVTVNSGAARLKYIEGTLIYGNLNVNSGLIDIEGLPLGESLLNTEIGNGGLIVQLDEAVGNIQATIKEGDASFSSDYDVTNENGVITAVGYKYQSSNDKVTIMSDISIGGIFTF